MTALSSAPRGEHTPTPGARWETELRWSGEQLADDGAPGPCAADGDETRCEFGPVSPRTRRAQR